MINLVKLIIFFSFLQCSCSFSENVIVTNISATKITDTATSNTNISEALSSEKTNLNIGMNYNPCATISSLSSTHTLFIEEIQESDEDKNRSNVRVFPAFIFSNDHWQSNANRMIKECNQFVEYPSSDNNLGAYCLDEWTKVHPINLNNYSLLKEGNSAVWGFKTNKIKIYSTIKIKSSDIWEQNFKPIPEKIVSIIQREFKSIHSKLNFPWSMADLETFKSFKSKNGMWLIGVRLNSKKNTKQFEENVKQFEDNEVNEQSILETYKPYEIGEPYSFTTSILSDHWFVVSKDKIKYLGPNLEPILAIDVLNNDRANWLMHYSGYNNDAYVMYDQDFDKKEIFSFSYH